MAENETNTKNTQKKHPNLTARVLPHNIEAEQATLGCIMIDQDAPTHILAELSEDDFYSKAHREIYHAMQNISQKNKPIDIVMLVQELETMGSMESVGGLTYLTTLSNIVPSASNHRHYCEIVKKNSTLRKLIESAQKITDAAFTGDADDSALQLAEREIFSIAEKYDRSSLVEIRSATGAAIDKMELMYNDPKAGKGVPTGYKRLNDMLNGFQPSDLIIIAARPGQGKTSIGMNFIQHAALNGDRRTDANKPNPYKCAVFSLEMPAVQLAKRMLCSVAKVNMANASSGKLSGAEWKRLYSAKSQLDAASIYIDDSSAITPMEILSKCRRLKRERGLDLVMIDYLQLMSSGKRVENRQQEISEITRTMKIAAKELNVPILLLSQMSRDITKRTDKRPQMSDLRESGAIEQDADIIMFIYREHDAHDLTVEETERNRVELIIAKHRNGETGSVELTWKGEYTSFLDVDKSSYLEKSMPPQNNSDGGSFYVSDESLQGSEDDFRDAPERGGDMKEISNMSNEQILSVDPNNSDDVF